MLIYWFLPMILFLGIVNSYEDIKFGKIKNKWILMAVFYSILVYFYLYFLNNVYNLNSVFILNFIINSALALITGFLMWNFELWTAGDAKLFFAFTVLIPISKLQGYFSFINFLANTFVPISIYFLVFAIFKTANKKKIYYFKKTFDIKTISNLILFIFGFSWLVSMAFGFLKLRNIALSLLILFLLYSFIERILKIKVVYISLLLSLTRLFVDSSVYSLKFARGFSFLVMFFIAIRIFLFTLGSDYFAKELKFNQLKEGMVPAEIIFKFKGKYHKRPIAFSISQLARKRTIGTPLFESSTKGLSKKEIRALQSLYKKLPFKTLRIQSTIPFAPFLFLGALLTILSENFLRLL